MDVVVLCVLLCILAFLLSMFVGKLFVWKHNHFDWFLVGPWLVVPGVLCGLAVYGLFQLLASQPMLVEHFPRISLLIKKEFHGTFQGLLIGSPPFVSCIGIVIGVHKRVAKNIKKRDEQEEINRQTKDRERLALKQQKREDRQKLFEQALDYWSAIRWSESSIAKLDVHLQSPAVVIAVGETDIARPAADISLGAAMDNHVIIVGHPGSGKTYLLSTIIMRLAHLYNPDELTLSLLDFKLGVGFKPFSVLPHARVLALDSDRELGLSALSQVDEEITRRGHLFREAGVENVTEYRQRTGLVLPRWVVVMDEWTELVSIDDTITKQCKSVIDRIVRLGRAFGVHLILASQSFPSSILPSSLMDMITCRILLKCGHDDYSRLITDNETTDFTKNVSDPGDFLLFNSTSNAKVWIDHRFIRVEECTGDYRQKCIAGMAAVDSRRPLLFDGGQEAIFPSHLMVADPNNTFKLWLGTPLSTERDYGITFKNQSGSNLAIVCRDNDLMHRVVDNIINCKSMVRTALEIIVIANTAEGIDSGCRVVRSADAKEEFSRLLDAINDGKSSDRRTFVVIPSIEELRSLRDDYGSERGVFLNLLESGSSYGVHLIVGAATARSLTNHIGSRGLAEFSFRVSGVLDESESTRLFDSSIASKLTKENRYVSYDDSKPGEFQKFIPYKRA